MPDIQKSPQYKVDTITSEAARIFDHTPDRDWLNPIAMSTLKRAVERKQTTVILNSVEFKISYGHYLNMPVSGERRELIRLKRVDGHFAPFGYVSVKRLQNFQFEDKS